MTKMDKGSRKKRSSANKHDISKQSRFNAPLDQLEGIVQPLELGQDGVTVLVEGMPITLTAGVPGETVRVSRGSSEDQGARLQGVVISSPQRVVPPCPLIGRCGGCALQEMDYRAQVAEKNLKLREFLEALGCAPEQIRPAAPLNQPYGFRTKLLMPASGAPWRLRFGFCRRGSLEPVIAEGCLVQHPLTLAVLAMARQILNAHGIGASQPKSEEGWLHALGVRVDPSGRESQLVLSGRDARLPVMELLAQQLGQIPSVQSVHLCLIPARTSYPLDAPFERIAGKRRMAFTLLGQTFMLSPGTFYQICAEGAERLAQAVLSLMPNDINCLADLYGGAGIFSLLSADRWKRAVVVEINPVAIGDLEHALSKSPQAGLLPLLGRVERRMDQVLDQKPDMVLVDPPRRGCHPEVIARLVEARPASILYVACGINSFKTDAKSLVDGGYRLRKAAAVDMFPHTSHLEVAALFQRGLE